MQTNGRRCKKQSAGIICVSVSKQFDASTEVLTQEDLDKLELCILLSPLIPLLKQTENNSIFVMQEVASFVEMKGICIINLQTNKSTLPVKLSDYVREADNSPLPTMATHTDWYDRWRQVRDIGLQSGTV